jgi:DNA adenine methylase
MGEMSGSPVGGRHQTGAWKFDVRWNVGSICGKIRKAAQKIEHWDVTCIDYGKVLSSLRRHDFVFVDPPYVEAGGKCYKHSFDDGLHGKLAERLKRLKQPWALTYDDCAMIHELYDWARISDLSFKYFMSSAYRSGQEMKQGKEVLITP